MNGLLLALSRRSNWEPADDLSWLFYVAIALIAVFFMLRAELWRRMFFERVDPRPAGLMRIAFGIAVLWTLVDMAPHVRFLFTDEGIYTTELARRYGGDRLSQLWDAERGFEHWWDLFKAMWGRFTVLHFRSDPPFVYGIYALALASATLMILGVRTRLTTFLTWLLAGQLYRYTSVFYNSGDFVVQIFLFLGVWTQWGQAYSIDSWRQRRKAILSGAVRVPALRRIPAWPLRLMMLQLTIIYCTTGLLKSGNTWKEGTALYYALNLDHFYRWPLMEITAWGQYLGVLPLMTIAVRWWEILFPLALVGTVLNAYENDRLQQRWPESAAWRRVASWLSLAAVWGIAAYLIGFGAYYYVLPRSVERRLWVTGILVAAPLVLLTFFGLSRRFAPGFLTFARTWILGKRFWLLFGLGMHAGIELSMNVGTFAQVMVATYLAWLSGAEIERFWQFVFSRKAAPGEAGRPVRSGALRWLLAPADHLLYRKSGPTYTVRCHADEPSIRRAALLRLWDIGRRLRFETSTDVPDGTFEVEVAGKPPVRGNQAGSALTAVLPGLWWLWPTRLLPGLATVGGSLANAILRQR